MLMKEKGKEKFKNERPRECPTKEAKSCDMQTSLVRNYSFNAFLLAFLFHSLFNLTFF